MFLYSDADLEVRGPEGRETKIEKKGERRSRLDKLGGRAGTDLVDW